MKKLLALLLVLCATPAWPQSTKLTLDTEINTNWPDNTSGAITPAILRSTVQDIVASYVDWLTCTVQGGIVYWNSTATPTCLVAGTNGQFLKTQGAGANPTWATPALPAADLTIASNNVVVGNKAGINQLAQELTTTSVLDFISTTAGQILQRGASIWSGTSTPTLGASGTLGSITFGNATSGTVTVQPVAGALTGTTMQIPSLSKVFTATIASGSTALNTAAIASTACNTTVAAAPGVVSTDVIAGPTFSGSTAGVTGYAPVTTGGLSIRPYLTNGTVNFEVCNATLASITPGAITLNWAIHR